MSATTEPAQPATERSAQEPAHLRTWSEDEIRALGVRTDLVTACGIAYGVGRSRAWTMFHAGLLDDFPVYRKGRRAWVPVEPLLRFVLGQNQDAA
jgi:hypothetical protein